MDRHDDVNVTPEELAQAHALDVEVQAKHGVNYLSYWYDRDEHSVFCFVDAPSREAAEAVHREAHGWWRARSSRSRAIRWCSSSAAMPAHPVGEAARGAGVPHDPLHRHRRLHRNHAAPRRREGNGARAHARPDRPRPARRVRRQRGEAHRRRHHGVVRFGRQSDRLRDRDPTRVRRAHAEEAEHPIHVRIGVSAGEPVAEGNDLFGAAVQLAARACDHAAAGAILTSTAVKELCVGKNFTFETRGPYELKGFEDLSPPPRSGLGVARKCASCPTPPQKEGREA